MFRIQDYHLLWSFFPKRFSTKKQTCFLALQPQSFSCEKFWFRLFPFRSPLLREWITHFTIAKCLIPPVGGQSSRVAIVKCVILFSFPLGTEMFYFPRCAHSDFISKRY